MRRRQAKRIASRGTADRGLHLQAVEANEREIDRGGKWAARWSRQDMRRVRKLAAKWAPLFVEEAP